MTSYEVYYKVANSYNTSVNDIKGFERAKLVAASMLCDMMAEDLNDSQTSHIDSIRGILSMETPNHQIGFGSKSISLELSDLR